MHNIFSQLISKKRFKEDRYVLVASSSSRIRYLQFSSLILELYCEISETQPANKCLKKLINQFIFAWGPLTGQGVGSKFISLLVYWFKPINQFIR